MQNSFTNETDKAKIRPDGVRGASVMSFFRRAWDRFGLPAIFQQAEDPAIVPLTSVKRVLIRVKRYFISAATFTGCINLLTLSGSLFMLQVYDRVLPSHSTETLLALIILVAVLYGFTSLLEYTRSKLFARIGRYVDLSIRDAVFTLNVNLALPGSRQTNLPSPFKDLDQIRNFLAGGGPAAMFDLPWMPLYVITLFLLHPWIGCMGLFGIASLTTMTWLTDRAMSPHQKTAFALTNEATALAYSVQQAAETIKPLGMSDNIKALWAQKHLEAGEAVISASDTSGLYTGISRFLRMTLQSLVLGLGAYLVISGKATGGVMIASSILLGKALSPVELAISHWRSFVASRESYRRLEAELQVQPASPGVQLPPPSRKLSVQGIYLGLPGQSQPILNNLNFELVAGDALGIMGPSGSGKSTLARALVGLWPLLRGTVRFDGSQLDQWSESEVGAFMGYMPQSVDLFAGTVGQNIARFHPDASSEAILEAAQITGVDAMVRGLSSGFDTDVGQRGERLSTGQRQRLALARTFYGNPFIVILDEPNSALDSEGEQALINAIGAVRNRGGIALVIAHRPNVLQTVSKLLILGNGQQQAFGPRDEVLKSILKPVLSQVPPTGGRAS